LKPLRGKNERFASPHLDDGIDLDGEAEGEFVDADGGAGGRATSAVGSAAGRAPVREGPEPRSRASTRATSCSKSA
jgi:hypothetical protein